MPTPRDLAARTERAVAAAAAAGRDLGITVADPRVLYDVFSVVVHLAPAPVVVRVPTVLPRTLAAHPGAQLAQQRRELAAARWLAGRGFPVVPPSPLVPPEPVRREGFSMTFWQLAEQIHDDRPDVSRRATLSAQLHAALRDYPAELPFLVPMDASIPDGLAQLEDHPEVLAADDLDRARREWAMLEPVVSSRSSFEAAFPEATVQAIHGDAPYYNIIVTAAGDLCSDFEHVTVGPVEWDIAYAGPDAHAAYNAAAAVLGLRSLDEQALRVMESARMLQLVACLSLADELPMLVEGLRPFIATWRTTPLTGGWTP